MRHSQNHEVFMFLVELFTCFGIVLVACHFILEVLP